MDVRIASKKRWRWRWWGLRVPTEKLVGLQIARLLAGSQVCRTVRLLNSAIVQKTSRWREMRPKIFSMMIIRIFTENIIRMIWVIFEFFAFSRAWSAIGIYPRADVFACFIIRVIRMDIAHPMMNKLAILTNLVRINLSLHENPLHRAFSL